jgi:hypothetical protein
LNTGVCVNLCRIVLNVSMQVRKVRLPAASSRHDWYLTALQELIDAVVLATTKSRTLCSMALTLMQKLLLNKALSDHGRGRAIEALRDVSTSKAHDDEVTKLKLLQTCLTILQVPGISERAEESRQARSSPVRACAG